MVTLALDVWLLISAIWSSVLYSTLADLASGDNTFSKCYNKALQSSKDFDHILFSLNKINVCLWVMVCLALPFTYCVDLIVQSLKECYYCFEQEDTKEHEHIHNDTPNKETSVTEEHQEKPQEKGVVSVNDVPINNEAVEVVSTKPQGTWAE
ncbi:hypothetical protein RFI_28176 [Reticulomyxa filosa]|uniref:Uncharacterized protein n=1 Tax=Reticulomyxa filosa TaxID=46433 RepID=X6M858_RETFI|nr:hypothetical protein RFI_28176 [Reticulomyxa filosa]|eukprot:ETO09210.1 hypothetical protein RFI_28176 [Reticulomyxa filosa]